MTPISERGISLGAEFVQTICYTCRGHANLPKFLYEKHNGYGTKKAPPQEQIDVGYAEAKKHNTSHDIVVFIGHG